MAPGTWLNAAMPGAGLLLRGRLALGFGFILPALFVLSALVLAQVVATSSAVEGWRLILAGLYLALAGAATALHASLLRERPVDGDVVRGLHRQVASAHLGKRPAEALAGARRLAAVAPGEPGAWRLLAVMAEEAGEARLAVKASRRATRLDAERQL